MSFGKKHLGSVLNKARSNIHNIRHINDTDLKRQFKQDFHYLGLMKTPDKIATNQKAVDSLSSIYKSCLDRNNLGIIGEIAELSLEYNLPNVLVNLMAMLVSELERTMGVYEISKIYEDNFKKILLMVVGILKVLSKNCNRFMFEVFVNLNGLKPVLSVFNSDIIVDQYIKQFDQSDSLGSSIPIINRIFEELLVVLNLVMRQSEKQIDWRVYDTWQTLFRFYKRIGAVNEEVKVLTCILVFKIIDDEELLNAINESTSSSLKYMVNPTSTREIIKKLADLILEFKTNPDSDASRLTLCDWQTDSATTTITDWNLIDLLATLNTLLNLSPPKKQCLALDIKLFESFCEHDSFKVQEFSKAIVNILNRSEASKEPTNPHVMLSYYPSDRDLCSSIKSSLEKLGYNVWMEEERSKTKTQKPTALNLDKMAKGIEDCLCVLMCVSDLYKECGQCRAEAEYAFNIGKPIVPLIMQKDFKSSGWVGIIMGTKIFVNFTKYEYDECIRRLENEIQPIMKPKKAPGNAAQPSDIAKEQVTDTKSKFLEPKQELVQSGADKLLKKLLTWSKRDVSAWLAEKSITNQTIRANLGADCNGQVLFELYSMKVHAPDFFFGFFRSDLESERLDLKELMAFAYELECLFSY